LHLAPLKEKNVKTALDFGTGTGIWAIEFGICPIPTFERFETEIFKPNNIQMPRL
jgi:hypothetical protein